MIKMVRFLLFIVFFLVLCVSTIDNTPEGTIQLLIDYSKSSKWESVKKLFSEDCLSAKDTISLRSLFVTAKTIAVETKIFIKDSAHAEAVIILKTNSDIKIGERPIELIQNNDRWKIVYSESTSLVLSENNYKPVDEAGVNCILGYKYNDYGDYRKAIELFRKCIQLRPDVIFAYWGLGIAYFKIGDYNNAIDVFNRCIIGYPNNPEMHYNLGNAYFYARRHDDAIKHFKRAIVLKSDFVEAYGGLGLVYRECGEYKAALEFFNRVLNLDSNNVLGYSNRGYTYFELQKYDSALKDFYKAIALDSLHKDSYVGLAITYYQVGDTEKAIKNYKKAIELDKRYAGKIDELGKDGIFYNDEQMHIINEILRELKQQNK